MTYDELLEKVDSKLQVCTCDGWNNNCWEDENQPWKALRAVVELHKADEPDDYGTIGCLACGYDSEYGQYLQAFPCPTRQAIEKELK